MNKFLSKIVYHLRDELYIVNRHGVISYFNHTRSELFGLSLAEMNGRCILDFPIKYSNKLLGQDSLLNSFLLSTDSTAINNELFFENVTISEHLANMSIRFLGIEKKEGFFQVTFAIKENIKQFPPDENKQENGPELKRKSQMEDDRLATLIETLPDAVFLKDGEGRWEIINTAALKIFRLENIDWKGKTDIELAEINIPLRNEHLFCSVSDQLTWDKGEMTKGEEHVPDIYGMLHFYEVIKVPLYHENKARKGLLIVGREFTDRKVLENEHKNDQLIQEQLNKILKISLEDYSIKECLDHILNVVINSGFVNLLNQGGIFLTDESGQVLNLVSQLNLPEVLSGMCASVPFGRCVCGKAAQSGKTIHIDCVNEIHENKYPGIKPHGHYSVPFFSHNEVLGVLVVYLEEGHKFNQKEKGFLESVGDIISGMIIRKNAEMQVREDIRFLESIDRISNILQEKSAHENLFEMNREILNAILEIFGADRARFVYPCDPETKFWRIPYECSKEEFISPLQRDQEYEMKPGFRQVFKNCLETNEPITFEPPLLPELDAENKVFSLARSCLSIAIRPRKGKPWLLGLQQCSSNRVWTNNEKKLFKKIAERYSFSLDSLLLLDELKKSEAEYRSLTETARDIIVSYTLEGNVKFINTVGQLFFGAGDPGHKQKNIFDYVPADHVEEIKKVFARLKEGGMPSRLFELKLLNHNREMVDFELSSSLTRFEDGEMGLISVIRNITERKLAEEKLIQQNEELQVINSELDRFVYSASHDLRAPLTSVLGLINITKEVIAGNEEAESYMEMMEGSILKLDKVIKSIIEYSRNNRTQTKFEPLDMQLIYNNAIESVQYIEGWDKVNKYAEINNVHPFISDKVRITTIVNNLITNAIKFRRDISDSFIKFSFNVNDREGVIIIEDNGEGIPEDKFGLIFEMFYRNSNTVEGTGLGLYIVKQNVTKLQGTIELKSEMGKGSSFTIRIPNNLNNQGI